MPPLVGLWLLLSLPLASHAFPIGAGDCPGGRAAVGSVHLSAGSVTTGRLEDNNLRVQINGQVLDPDSPSIILQAGVEHAWMVADGSSQSRQPSEGFRGFLLRLGGGRGVGEGADDAEIDTTVALSSASDNVKEAFAACVLSQGVGGVTHNENELKTAVSGILRLDEIASDLQLDVTVVVENRNSNSVYYYSSYTLEFREEAQPTTGSSPSPTAAPSNPSIATTTSPTDSPTSSTPVTDVPTVGPTMAPTTTLRHDTWLSVANVAFEPTAEAQYWVCVLPGITSAL